MSLEIQGGVGGTVPLTPGGSPGGGAVEQTSSILPLPTAEIDDPMDALQLLSARASQCEEKSATEAARAEGRVRAEKQAERRAALDRAREAEASRSKGIFDSLGVGAIVGVVTAQPLLVVADMAVHTAGLLPKDLRKLEKDALDVVEDASKGALGAEAALSFIQNAAGGPARAAALLMLSATVVEETEVLGERGSAWAGAAMRCASGDPKLVATSILADKDSKLADDVRAAEAKAQPALKWVQFGATIAAGVALTLSTGGAAAPAVAIGLALSSAGFLMSECKEIREALEGAVGKSGAQWLSFGASAGGAIIMGGASMGTQVTSAVGKAAIAGGKVLSGGVETANAGYALRDARIAHEVAVAMTDKKRSDYEVERTQRAMDAVTETIRSSSAHRAKMNELIQGYREAQLAATQAAYGMRG